MAEDDEDRCGDCQTEEPEEFCFPCGRALCSDCYMDAHEEHEVDEEEEEDEDEDEED